METMEMLVTKDTLASHKPQAAHLHLVREQIPEVEGRKAYKLVSPSWCEACGALVYLIHLDLPADK